MGMTVTRSILQALRVDPERVRQPARPKKWRRQFVHVPWQWVERLRKAKRISTYRLALVLLYEHWRTGGRPIALSNVGMQQEGLARRSKWNALSELRDPGPDHGGNPIRQVAPHCPAPPLGTNMSTIVHTHLSTIVLRLARQPEHDRSQVVPILYSVLS